MSTQLTSSKYQTKQWRLDQVWYKGGKSTECEKYQREQIEKIIGEKCHKNNERLNRKTLELKIFSNPITKKGGYYWTEDCDGKITTDKNNYSFNLKMVCDSGGAQTRTLREVFIFVETQLNHINKFEKENTYFINILEGDQSHKQKFHFNDILNEKEYEKIKKFVFVGDLVEFKQWWSNHNE